MTRNEANLSFEKLNAGLELISRKWQPLIVYLLNEQGEMGFNQIKEHLEDISGKVLSESLKNLTEKGMVSKEVISESPKRVNYKTTRKGRDMMPVLEELMDWGDKYVQGETSEKLLVVDDEQKLADMYTKWLEDQYNVETAYNGEQAIKKADENTKLVLLDRMMPDISGKQVLKTLRDSIDNFYAVMLTAKDPEPEIADMEIDDYMVKPVSQDELNNKIEEVLDRQQFNDLKQQLKALTSKKQVLEDKISDQDLKQTQQYRQLVQKIRNLRQQLQQQQN